MTNPRNVFLLGATLQIVTGCGDVHTEPSVSIEIAFDARTGGAPFSCESAIEGVGLGADPVKPSDLRMFVHDVRVRDSSGSETPVVLDDDGAFQHNGLALLDFETGSGSCGGGTVETHTSLLGRVEGEGNYAGLAFKIGIPQMMNHLAAATAPPPLNTPGMWWTWSTGYRYLRADVASELNPEGYFFHLGGMGCDGSPKSGLSCEYPNLAEIELEGGDATNVILEFEKLFAGVDVNRVFDPDSGNLPGCMSGPNDEECPPMFETLGLGFAKVSSAEAPQSVFRLDSN